MRGHRAHLPRFYWSLYCVLFELFKRVVMKTQILHSLAVNVTPAAACLGLMPPVGNQQECLSPYLLSGKSTRKKGSFKDGKHLRHSVPWSWFWKSSLLLSVSSEDRKWWLFRSCWCEVLVSCLALRKHDREKISPVRSRITTDISSPSLQPHLKRSQQIGAFGVSLVMGNSLQAPLDLRTCILSLPKVGCNLFWLFKADENRLWGVHSAWNTFPSSL